MSSPVSDAPLPASTVCPVCGQALSSAVMSGQCPRCLLVTGSMSDESYSDDALDDDGQPRRFGDYLLLREIARGGMGVVFLARHERLGREVALKVILTGALSSPSAHRMFQTEAQAAAALHHPNIVPVYETGEHEMQPYFTMRYVRGGQSIARWAAAQVVPDFRAIALAVAKVARAVAHAHERGVLHRDLKPSNILWDPSGEPQVTDFGLAKLVNAQDHHQTQSLHMSGSPSYMAPEQAAGRGDQITTATDVYGIGAVLYELLSGRPPFDGPSLAVTSQMVLEQAPPPLSGVPRDLRILCGKCLAKRSEDRYPSAVALAEDLERFARGEPVTAVPLTPWQTAWRWALRKPALAALLLLSALLLVVGVSGITWQWRLARHAQRAQARALAHVEWQQIDRWLEEDQAPRALAFLASILRDQPGCWQAVMYAMSIIDQHSFPVRVGPAIQSGALLAQPAQLSPDGRWLVIAGVDQRVIVHDAATSRELARHDAPAAITALAVGPEGAALGYATQAGQVLFHASAVSTAAPRALTRQLPGPVKKLVITPDGTRVFGWSETGVEVWTLGRMEQPPVVFQRSDPVPGMAVAGDGTRLLVWSRRQAVVWEVASQRELCVAQASTEFTGGTISAQGQRMSLIDGTYRARSWDVDAQREFPVVETSLLSIRHVVLDATGERLTLGGSGNDLLVHDVASGLKVSGKMRHHYAVQRVSGTVQGRRTFSCGMDGEVRVWDAATGSLVLGPISKGAGLALLDFSASADGASLLVTSSPQKDSAPVLEVWQATALRHSEVHVVSGQRDFNTSRISPDGRYGCLGLSPGDRCYLYDLATGKAVLDKVTAGDVYVILFSPDSRQVYAFTANGWRYGWDLETGRELWPPAQEPGKIRPGDISPDGTRLIAGHNDGHVRIYDTATGALLRTLDHPGEVKVLRFAPDRSGRFLSASTDQTAHVWDLQTGERLQSFHGHTHTIISAAWSPDSRLIATASYDTTVRLWDVRTGALMVEPMAHSTWLSHVEFSPDGTLLATACRDGTARLWHRQTGQPASPPLEQGETCETVRFTADSKVLLVRDHGGFRCWDTEKAEPREPALRRACHGRPGHGQ